MTSEKMQELKNRISQMRFPQKLWYLLNLNTEALLWGSTGRTLLLNYRVLHNYLQCDHSVFKTTNISSFVRQLNLYGFRKVTSHLQDPVCNSSNPYMHEYVHDYFHYGRPELLNKITRKALTMKKNFKLNQSLFSNKDQSPYITPLQKARRALRIALKKAAQDMYIHNASKQINHINFDCDDTANECDDEDNYSQCDWSIAIKKDEDLKIQQNISVTEPLEIKDFKEGPVKTLDDIAQTDIMNLNDEQGQQTNDNFPSQFLSMPDLDPEPPVENTGIELLAEFDIDCNTDQIITQKISNKDNDHINLNCVLPFVSNYRIDDVSMTERNSDESGHHNGEWDQMFNEMMTNRNSSQESASDLKDLYSQISRTIDLLNP